MQTTNFTGPVQSDNGFIIGTGDIISGVLKATATLNFAEIAAAGSADLTITVTGAAGLVFNAFVSAANTVTVRASNITASPVDADSASYTVVVTQVTAQ